MPGTRAGKRKKAGAGIPWLKVMIAVIAIIVLAIVYLSLSSPVR